MLKKGVALSWMVLVLISGKAFAFRPLGTEDAGVAGKGVVQVEVSWDYLKWDNAELDQEKVFQVVPIFGITESLELSIEIPYNVHDLKSGGSEEGTGDINAVAKYLLIPGGKDAPAFTLKGVVKMDSGDYDKGLGSGDKDYSIIAVTSDTVGQLTGHIHFGHTWIGKKKNENLRDITLYGVALEYAMTDEFHLVGEYNGSRHPDSTAKEDPRSALAGFTYKVSEKLTFDAAYRWGLSDSVPKWGTTVGASISY